MGYFEAAHTTDREYFIKNIKALNDTRKLTDQEVNAEKTKYTFLPRHPNTGKIHGIKMANRALENVKK
jgi:hypothetical protein